ncbi:MAG: flagellar hook-associated protein FlgK [Acidobacteriaceae bacterium]|nr:flagellar hook-associated protein FlgK [Acidobacteriaceae bacterium]
MSSLFASLQTAAGAMDIFQNAMAVIQNNVANANTPGYVTQTLNLAAQPFQPENGLVGGVQADGTQTSRNQFAEQSVWTQNSALGAASAQSSSLSALQSYFDITGKTGIPAGLSSLYSAFSAWSANPSDTTARTQVLAAAQQVIQAFNQTANQVSQLESQTNGQLSSTTAQINALTSKIVAINVQIRNGDASDPGLQAQLYNDLEQLSNYSTISVQTEADGTATVLMNGQIPLVIGTTQTQLSVSYATASSPTYPNAPASANVITSSGQGVTSEIGTAGQLGGLLQFRNTTLPSIIGSQQVQGSLNQLGQAIADRVNSVLTAGQVSSGPPPVAGLPVLSYTAGSPTDVASSLSLNSAITPANLAAIQPGPPPVSNGVPDQLSQLANPTNPADMLNGLSFTDFYSGVASNVGSEASAASTAQSTNTDLLNQAQSMRAQLSGVSLNDQAAKLLEFQQAYQASAQVINTVNNMMQTLMNMMGIQ